MGCKAYQAGRHPSLRASSAPAPPFHDRGGRGGHPLGLAGTADRQPVNA